jgi:hypothetical protein
MALFHFPKNHIRFAMILWFCLAVPCLAAELGIEALQGPAWVERDGTRQPASSGQRIAAGTTLHSGKKARAVLRLSDGSRLQLGENSTLRREPDTTAETLRLAIPQGSYRITSAPASSLGIQLKTSGLALDIRHADVWGVSLVDGDNLCLIEGRVVAMRGNKLFSLEEAPFCLDAVPAAKQLDEHLQQTALVGGHGTRRADGRWKVNLLSLPGHDALQLALARLRDGGYVAEIVQVEVRHKKFFRLRIVGLASRNDAQHLAQRLKDENLAGEPWVSAN